MAALLVSDRERDYTIELLRGHMLSGRLTADEFEERVEEACRARYAEDLWRALRWLPVESPPVATRAPAGRGSPVAALITGLVGLSLLVMSFGFLSIITAPLGITAWSLGREARRSGSLNRGAAVTGEVLGALTTMVSLLVLAGCALVIAG